VVPESWRPLPMFAELVVEGIANGPVWRSGGKFRIEDCRGGCHDPRKETGLDEGQLTRPFARARAAHRLSLSRVGQDQVFFGDAACCFAIGLEQMVPHWLAPPRAVEEGQKTVSGLFSDERPGAGGARCIRNSIRFEGGPSPWCLNPMAHLWLELFRSKTCRPDQTFWSGFNRDGVRGGLLGPWRTRPSLHKGDWRMASSSGRSCRERGGCG